MLGREHLSEALHVRLDQRLEGEHHPRTALGVGGGPGGLDALGGLHRTGKQRGITQRDFGLDFAGRRVPDGVLAGRGGAVADNEMVDLTHGNDLLSDLPNAPRVRLSQPSRLPSKVLARRGAAGQVVRATRRERDR